MDRDKNNRKRNYNEEQGRGYPSFSSSSSSFYYSSSRRRRSEEGSKSREREQQRHDSSSTSSREHHHQYHYHHHRRSRSNSPTQASSAYYSRHQGHQSSARSIADESIRKRTQSEGGTREESRSSRPRHTQFPTRRESAGHAHGAPDDVEQSRSTTDHSQQGSHEIVDGSDEPHNKKHRRDGGEPRRRTVTVLPHQAKITHHGGEPVNCGGASPPNKKHRPHHQPAKQESSGRSSGTKDSSKLGHTAGVSKKTAAVGHFPTTPTTFPCAAADELLAVVVPHQKIPIPGAAMGPILTSFSHPHPPPPPPSFSQTRSQLDHFQEGLVLDKLTPFLRTILLTFYIKQFPEEWASSPHQISLQLMSDFAKREGRRCVLGETPQAKFAIGGLDALDTSALRILIQGLVGKAHPVISSLVEILCDRRNELYHSAGLTGVVAEMGKKAVVANNKDDEWVRAFLDKFQELFQVDQTALMEAIPKRLEAVRSSPLMYVKYRNFLKLTVSFIMDDDDFRTAGKTLEKTWKEVRSEGNYDLTGILILTYFCEHRVHTRLDEFLERIHYNQFVAKTDFFRDVTTIGAAAEHFLEDFESSGTGQVSRIPRKWFQLGMRYLSLVTQFRAICRDGAHPAWNASDNHDAGGAALAAIRPFRCYQGLGMGKWQCSGSCCGGGGKGGGGRAEQFTDLQETLLKSTMIHSVGIPMAWSSLNTRNVEPVIGFLMRDLLGEEHEREVKLQAYFDYFCLVLRSYKGWLSEVAKM